MDNRTNFEREMVNVKPDVLIVWPSQFDYPLARWQVGEYRKLFGKVIISTYKKGEIDFRPFLKQTMNWATHVDNGEDGPDWRERCTMAALRQSESEWVLFLEQDFMWKDEHYLETVFQQTTTHDVIGIKDGNRLHPCFLLVRKTALEKTSLDFAYQGENKDHFQKVTAELMAQNEVADLREMGLMDGVDWYHFSSMTWNLGRITSGDVKEFHEPAEFLVYNELSRTKKVTQDARWMAFTYYAETLLSRFGWFINRL
jgi:molybdopterin-guanine dinucleotide biosynthesis protein A